MPPHDRARRTRTALAGALGAATVAIAVAAPQQPAYRAETELVRITATVSDAQGQPVLDLTRDDFAVAEDGVPQTIALFTRDADTPLSIVLVIDVSGSMSGQFENIREGVRDFVTNAKPDDEIALVTFDSRVHRLVGPTGTREQLMSELDRLQAGGGTALYAGMIGGLDVVQRSRHAKKVVLVVTDGNNTSHRTSPHAATKAFEHSEALVYALGIGHGGRDSLGHRVLALFDAGRMRTLRSLADRSGGRAELIDAPDAARGEPIVRMINAFLTELRQQYTLGYYPQVPRSDKKAHLLRVTSRPGLVVRARKVYVRP